MNDEVIMTMCGLSPRKINAIIKNRKVLLSQLLKRKTVDYEKAFAVKSKTDRGFAIYDLFCAIRKANIGVFDDNSKRRDVVKKIGDILTVKAYSYDEFVTDHKNSIKPQNDGMIVQYDIYKLIKQQRIDLETIFDKQLLFLADIVSESYKYFEEVNELETIKAIFQEYGILITDRHVKLDSQETIGINALELFRYMKDYELYDLTEKNIIRLAIEKGYLDADKIVSIIKHSKELLERLTGEKSYATIIDKALAKFRNIVDDIDTYMDSYVEKYIPKEITNESIELAIREAFKRYDSITTKLNSIQDISNLMKGVRTDKNIDDKKLEEYVGGIVRSTMIGISIHIENTTYTCANGNHVKGFTSSILYSALLVDVFNDKDILMGMDIFMKSFAEMIQSEDDRIVESINSHLDKLNLAESYESIDRMVDLLEEYTPSEDIIDKALAKFRNIVDDIDTYMDSYVEKYIPKEITNESIEIAIREAFDRFNTTVEAKLDETEILSGIHSYIGDVSLECSNKKKPRGFVAGLLFSSLMVDLMNDEDTLFGLDIFKKSNEEMIESDIDRIIESVNSHLDKLNLAESYESVDKLVVELGKKREERLKEEEEEAHECDCDQECIDCKCKNIEE